MLPSPGEVGDPTLNRLPIVDSQRLPVLAGEACSEKSLKVWMARIIHYVYEILRRVSVGRERICDLML